MYVYHGSKRREGSNEHGLEYNNPDSLAVRGRFALRIAAKKGITSAILIIVGLVLAGAIGLTIPFITTADIWTHVVNIFMSQASHIGAIFYAMPLFWIVGFGIGLWKG